MAQRNMNKDFVPKNEQGVILVFSQCCGELGYEIEYIRSTYPDAYLFDNYQNTKLFAEFEYHANNFYIHKHDPEKVDLIICWERGNKKFPVPILEMSTLTSYPPNLYTKGGEITSLNRLPKEAYHHQLLVSNEGDVYIYLYERNDGNEASVIISDSHGNTRSMEFEKENDSNVSKLVWKAVELSKRSGKRGENDSELAEQAKGLIIQAFVIYSKAI